MKLSTTILLPLILAATAGTAFAQNAPLTRAQVKAELAEAIRTGNVLADSETGLKLNEINPSNYPAKPGQTGKTRAQVRAELDEARRLGLVNFSDNGYPIVTTPEQAEQIRQAGLRAAGDMTVGQLNQQ
ncbi:hypothetical protein ASE11_06810 [Hydrogenophaga sp. Root209]|nr:hypothetical protein ASE11_06810 [Hydrogenophaga sp. Root209]